MDTKGAAQDVLNQLVEKNATIRDAEEVLNHLRDAIDTIFTQPVELQRAQPLTKSVVRDAL